MKRSPYRAARNRGVCPPRTYGKCPGLVLARNILLVVVPWAISVADVSATPSGDSLSHRRLTTDTPHPAVVRVIVPEGRSISLGSGTLVAVEGRHGLVITNWHVIRDAGDRIEVAFPDGFRSQATLLAADRDWDLAALAIWRPNVGPIPLANQAPWPGDPLTIAGYGSGRYRTATGRCVQYVSPGANHPFEMVELAASAREGDSGGPILNQRGELAGVLFGATWGRTAGSHTVPVRRFLASVADKFDTLAEAPATLAQLPQSAHNRPGRPAELEAHRLQGGPRSSVRQPDVVAACPSSRIGSEVSVASTALKVDGWAASPQANRPDTTDTPQAALSTHPDATPAPDSPVRGYDTGVSQSPGWQPMLGSTPSEQMKTILAAIGLLTVLLQAWRLLGKG